MHQLISHKFRTSVVIIVCSLLITAILTQLQYDELQSNPCTSKETCSECIAANPNCGWCQRKGNFSFPRCDDFNRLAEHGCIDQIYFPTHTYEPIEDEELTHKTPEVDPIQLRPQRVRLTLRPNTSFSLPIMFKQARDYPVDLYYLMDLSKSMEDDKAKLAELGHLLASSMRNITSKFQLGFGSFVDKVVMPYVSTVPGKLEEPCTGCVKPYGFKNHMPLGTDTNYFVSEVNGTRISGNLDAPEGGFDALMQAIVCKNQINWRDISRKIVVFSTDAGFHYAGDGKLGGIVKPNDGECHLDRSGFYTESITQDYPSISQINHKVYENRVHIIFAVTASQYDIYKQLAEGDVKLIQGSTTGKLENDSSNIVELIKDEYLKITSEVVMHDNSSDYVSIVYKSKCLGNTLMETSRCSGLRVGDSVEFEAVIKVKSCPRNPSEWNQTIHIFPEGLTDSLYIDLQMICECECEKYWNEELGSGQCSFQGTYECGICTCDTNFYGRFCECDRRTADPATEEDSCRFRNDSKVCSGRGVCRCGKCECNERDENERVWGQYCECDNFSCDRFNGEVCSGRDHGECDCGLCMCTPGWSGSDCSCKDSTADCIDPNTKLECNGHGKCVCGRCVCEQSGEDHYTGQFCEECPTCKSQCEVYKECVQCRIHQSGPAKDDENCSHACQPVGIEVIGTSLFEVEEGEQLCVFIDDDDCKFQFKYKYEGEVVTVIAQNTKDCPEPVDVLAIVIGVIVGIVLIGLALLLIWKLLTTIHDRREFAKFEKERMMAKWDTGENPIFKQATTTFKNPTYGGKQ